MDSQILMFADLHTNITGIAVKSSTSFCKVSSHTPTLMQDPPTLMQDPHHQCSTARGIDPWLKSSTVQILSEESLYQEAVRNQNPHL